MKVTRACRKETLTDVLNKTEEKLALSQPVNFGSLEQNHTIIASSPSNVPCIKVACVSMHFLLLLLLLLRPLKHSTASTNKNVLGPLGILASELPPAPLP